MKITLCSSATFFDRLVKIKDALEANGHEVLSPHVLNWSNKTENEISKVQHDLIKRHFKNIDCSDAIYVANYGKNNIKGYIGGNVLLEMGKAFDKNIPIFLLDEVPSISYRGEILALKPIIIGEDWEKIDIFLGKR